MCAGKGDGAPGKISSSALAAGFFFSLALTARRSQECRVIIFASSDGQSAPHQFLEASFFLRGARRMRNFAPQLRLWQITP